jgi:hypothetical protein
MFDWMARVSRTALLLACLSAASSGAAEADFFVREVWSKIGAQKCLKCHKQGGDAEESEFVLLDPAKETDAAAVLNHNRTAFTKMARAAEKDESRLLLKATGQLDHEGEEVVVPGSSGFEILASFVKQATTPTPVASEGSKAAPKRPAMPFFDGVAMLDDRALLRRATLSLAGRLPSPAEIDAVAKDGRKAMGPILDVVMQEDAFYERLREGFNDIFLTLGFDGGAETALSYTHFSETRLWYQKHDLTHIKDEKERRQAGYKLANDYRAAILGEPMKLIEHIVRNDHPFTEILTADYIMVSPFSARGYGVYDELKDKFKDPEDPFEYVPVKLKALTGRDKQRYQDSATGFYPHAGILSTFQYLRRYPTTETNRNRLRARMFYQHFLGVDVLELAARVTDAAAVTAKYEIPTMQAAECVVCHKTLDPVSSLFQDYYDFEGVYGKRKDGWYHDMFQAGFEGEDMSADERWRALQWLGERTVKDPRFATTMVGHAYYILTGRKPLLAPKDIDDPLYAARQRAYDEQQQEIATIAGRFVDAKFNLKTAFKEWVVSDFYRADGLTTAVKDPARLVELEDIGVVRMLSPEQIERKIGAVFGTPWGRLKEQLAILYGGIDSKEVTERATDPSGAMGAIQRTLSNDLACRHTAADFLLDAKERKLFPKVDVGDLPGTSPEVDARIRETIADLHLQVLGRQDATDSAEVDRTFQLLAGVIADAKDRKGVEKTESYYCRFGKEVPDPNYTIRAWRATLTYLLRRREFLYE